MFLALPFADGWVALELNAGAFFILAVAGLEVFGVILGGYASGSKWSLYGAMREAAQVVSYEIPLGLCVVVPVLICRHDGPGGDRQRSGGLVLPTGTCSTIRSRFVTFWVYVTCAVASTNRAPFDLPEAESELVAGFLTEYSGFRWVIFFMAEYAAMFVVSGLAAVLFLGGWNGPVPVARGWGLRAEHGPVLGLDRQPAGDVQFHRQGRVGVTCMIWLRWTLPRLRIDQVMTTCLKYCVPLASAMLAGAMLWMFSFPGGLIASFGIRPRRRSESSHRPSP